VKFHVRTNSGLKINLPRFKNQQAYTTLPYVSICLNVHIRAKIRGVDKSLARPTSLSIVFSVHGTGGSRTGSDSEIRVGDQETLEAQVGHFLLGWNAW
jgi:hypothetical protein